MTRDEIYKAMFSYTVHHNMGESGYGYEYKCETEPRLSFIDRTLSATRKNPDARMVREWWVDGAQCATVEAAAEALQKPPVLTGDEARILAMIPDEFVPLRGLEDELAGVERPHGGIMPDTPHSRVLRWLHWLDAKGMIELGRTPDRGDGQPWSDAVPKHMQWMPTIRRRATSR